MFFNHWWLVALLIVVLIIFGPGKLPQIGGAVGQAMREFRKATTELKDEVARSTEDRPAATGTAATATPESSTDRAEPTKAEPSKAEPTKA